MYFNKNHVSRYLVVIVLTLALKSSAQYQPTITQSKEWLIKSCEFGNCLYDYYYFLEDTTIGNHTYKVLDGFHYNKNFYLREDVQQRQVFLLVNDGSPFLSEYLLYDYGMQVGDSTYVQNPISPASSIEGYYYLDSIVVKPFEQVNRKVFYLHGWDLHNTYHETKWIEGIGSTGLINTPGVIGDTAAMAELLCVSENVQKIYSRKQDDTCYSNQVLNKAYYSLSKGPLVYYDHLGKTLCLENVETSTKISIWRPNGELAIECGLTSGSHKIDLSNLDEGFYVVQCQSGNQIEILKIILTQ